MWTKNLYYGWHSDQFASGDGLTSLDPEEGVDASEANHEVMNKLVRAIKAKKPEVFDNSFTLVGGYVVEGREYEWPKP